MAFTMNQNSVPAATRMTHEDDRVAHVADA